LASTARQYRPIADPVLQGAWLGILNGLPLEPMGWTHGRITIESKDDMPSPKERSSALATRTVN
jgi:hypothetical protein